MDKLRAMQVFVRIVDDGSLTAAARSLDASLPAVVRTLAALEDQLGVRLLNRTTRRIALTDEGKHYLERCRRILADVEEAEQAMSTRQAEPSGTLVITAPVLFGQHHVAPAVTRFVRRHDKVRCSLMLYDHVVNLVEQGIDVGIRIGHLADSTLIAHEVGKIRRVVVASPAYLRKHGTPRHPRELAGANCMHIGAALKEWPFHDGARKFNVQVSGNLDFNYVAPGIEACAQDMGFGMFLSYQVADYVAQKRLRIVLAEFEPPQRPVNIVYPSARQMSSRLRVFVAWMQRELKAVL